MTFISFALSPVVQEIDLDSVHLLHCADLGSAHIKLTESRKWWRMTLTESLADVEKPPEAKCENCV